MQLRYGKWFAMLLMVMLVSGQATAEPDDTRVMRYGISVSAFGNVYEVDDLGLSWAKVYNPPPMRLPSNILYRYDVNAYTYLDLDFVSFSLSNITADYGENIEAYQIGNEPNLSAEWYAPPTASEYVAVLCEAYGVIKQYDPDALVISAGLATVGRIPGEWNGQSGHDGSNQDERAYLQAFLDAGGAECADAIGYNALGFRADFDANPDEETEDPDTNCGNGFCFRTIEQIRGILVDNGYEDKPVWATEVGWITAPPSACLNSYDWQTRTWQTVSNAKQSENITGAIQYAENNYDWMGALFLWNLDFNQVPYYECDQMRFYSIMEREAFVEIASVMGVLEPTATVMNKQTAYTSPYVVVVAAVLTLIVTTALVPKSRTIGE